MLGIQFRDLFEPIAIVIRPHHDSRYGVNVNIRKERMSERTISFSLGNNFTQSPR
jgi:hypothetical protein